MCLDNCTIHVDDFLTKYANRKYIECFKVCKLEDGKLIAPYTKGKGFVYKPGKNISSSKSVSYCKKNKSIGPGIHIALTEKRAYVIADNFFTWSSKNVHLVILKVRCYIEDLIGVGYNDEAAFRAVHISRETYKKAMGA